MPMHRRIRSLAFTAKPGVFACSTSPLVSLLRIILRAVPVQLYLNVYGLDCVSVSWNNPCSARVCTTTGVKEASEAKRNFSKETQEAGATVIGLQAGALDTWLYIVGCYNNLISRRRCWCCMLGRCSSRRSEVFVTLRLSYADSLCDRNKCLLLWCVGVPQASRVEQTRVG